MRRKLNAKADKSTDWQKRFMAKAKKILKENKISDPNHRATVALSLNKDAAQSIMILINQQKCSKKEFMENISIFLKCTLYKYYLIDKKRKIIRAFIKAGMKLDDLINLREALEDESHKDYVTYNLLEETMGVLDEEAAVSEAKEEIVRLRKSRRRKMKKKKKNSTLN
jgi:hypothetical protein